MPQKFAWTFRQLRSYYGLKSLLELLWELPELWQSLCWGWEASVAVGGEKWQRKCPEHHKNTNVFLKEWWCILEHALMSPPQSGCQAGAVWNYSALLQHVLDYDFRSGLLVCFSYSLSSCPRSLLCTNVFISSEVSCVLGIKKQTNKQPEKRSENSG